MIKIRNISKLFNGKTVLQDFTLNIDENRFYTIMGPNGCGKSTLLNIIAGILEKDSGEICREIDELKIGYVWQDYRSSLFPWLSITENISFPFKVKGVSSKERKAKVQNLIGEFGIDLNIKDKIYNLSGGQQQLVSILRAMIIMPNLFLLDEPFSALDQYIRWQIGFNLEKMWLKHKSSVLFVSHDVDEAILLADEIILINKNGRIEKILTNVMPRSRTKDMMTSREHIVHKNEIVEFLFEQTKR